MRTDLRRIITALLVSAAACYAQQTAQAIYQRYAPIDLTGNWVSVVTEDWAIRMLTPSKGDFVSLPLNAAGQKIGNEWDPAHDQATGEPQWWHQRPLPPVTGNDSNESFPHIDS